MREINLAGGLVTLKHWKIDNPGKAEDGFVDQPLLLADPHPRAAGQICRRRLVSAGKEYRISIGNTRGKTNFLGLFLPQSLCHRAARLAFTIDDITHAGGAFGLRPAVHPVGNGAAAAFRPGNRANNAATLDGFGENRKARPPKGFGDVANLDRDPQVRLVIAIFQHRLGERNVYELLVDSLVGKLLKDATDHRLDSVENILLLDKAHLEVELIEFAGAAISAAVLIAETGRDLEIAVESGDHDKLLELLRCLRQCIEFAGMKTRRHQKVTRTFRR